MFYHFDLMECKVPIVTTLYSLWTQFQTFLDVSGTKKKTNKQQNKQTNNKQTCFPCILVNLSPNVSIGTNV